MLTRYLERAMAHACLNEMPGGRVFAKIEECPGMWPSEPTGETCLAEQRETLESWLALKLRNGGQLPVIDGIDLGEDSRSFMRNGERTMPLPDTATEAKLIDDHVLERFPALAGIDEAQWEKRGSEGADQ